MKNKNIIVEEFSNKDICGISYESINILGDNGVSFCIEKNRGMDISCLKYCGITISYLSPFGVKSETHFDYSQKGVDENMFLGLLSTCGLENAGPKSEVMGEYFCQHGSQNYIKAQDIKIMQEDDYISITGILKEEKFKKHTFITKRTIIFNNHNNTIEIKDKVTSHGDSKQQICIMYHYNFGEPFLSSDCTLSIPYKKAIAKTEYANNLMEELIVVRDKSINQSPQVFYIELNESEDEFYCCKIQNSKLKIGIELEFKKDTLPVMDLWKSFHSDRYTLAIEPCNRFPYGRGEQLKQGNAQYLKPNESIEFVTKVKIKEL